MKSRKAIFALSATIVTCMMATAAEAQIFPTAEITPDPLEFSDTRVGTSSAAVPVTVTKTAGQLPVFIFSTRLGNTSDFTIASDSCSQATLADVGDSCTVLLAFTPLARGHFSTTFSVISLSQEVIDSSIVEGDGVEPAVTLSTSSIAFGDQTVGKSSAAREVLMLNSGNEALAITSITASDGFSVTDDCGDTLAADASCNIFGTFTPAAVQDYTGTITITDDASDSPQSISLTGAGVAPGQPDADVSKKEIDFGNQLQGTTSDPQTVTLLNTGTVNLTINSITASADFGVTDDCGATLAPDDSCTLSATFTPPAVGEYTGTILVDDDASDSPQSISLTGSGVSASGPQASFSTTSIDFGQQAVNQRSEPQVITLTNSGDENLIVDSVDFGGDNPDAYDGVDDCDNDTLQPGRSCSGAITFYPIKIGRASCRERV